MTVLGPAVGEKLTRDNWILRKAQFLPAIRGAQLTHYLNEDTKVPLEKITVLTDDKKEVEVLNPDYKLWVAQDQQILTYLLNSITKKILGHVATKVIAASAWKALEELYSSQSRAKITNVRFALANTKEGAMTMAQYFTKMKGFVDELATSGKILDDEASEFRGAWQTEPERRRTIWTL
jgi:predicted transcriptional regulator